MVQPRVLMYNVPPKDQRHQSEAGENVVLLPGAVDVEDDAGKLAMSWDRGSGVLPPVMIMLAKPSA